MTQYIKLGADLQQYILSCILTNVTLISTVGGGGVKITITTSKYEYIYYLAIIDICSI